ncbi:hypothetical protein GGI43DRAFT_280245 [Trichoderma evansii]
MRCAAFHVCCTALLGLGIALFLPSYPGALCNANGVRMTLAQTIDLACWSSHPTSYALYAFILLRCLFLDIYIRRGHTIPRI